ncbi:MAG: FlgD immunoglobulin-like domain containing protein [Candidatus Krumholzibacteriia bacterium]
METCRSRLSRAAALGALATILLFCIPVAQAQDCLTFSDFMHWAGSVSTVAGPQGVIATDDSLLIVPEGPDGVEIFRFTQDQGPVSQGVIPALEQANVVISRPPYLVVGDGTSLVTYDLTAPEAPVAIDTLAFALGEIRALVWGPENLLVGHESSGVSVVSLSPDGRLDSTDTLMLGGLAALDIAIGPDVAYVAGGDTLYVLDTATPSLTLVGQLDLPGQAYSVAAEGGTVYLACPDGGLQVVDANDPTTPMLIGSVDAAPSRDLLVGGAMLYSIGEMLDLFDLGDPLDPTPAGSVQMPDTEGTGLAWFGEMLIAADGAAGLQGFENAANPPVLASGEFRLPSSGVNDLATLDNLVVLAPQDGPPLIVDVADPAYPVEVGPVNAIPIAKAVATVTGGFCSIAADGELSVVALADPANPALIGACSTGVVPEGCVIDGNFIYVAAGADGLLLVDVSNPFLPQPVRLVDTPGFASRVAVAGGIAYVADGDAGLTLIDVSDPAAAAVIGTHDTNGTALGVAVSGFRAFVAADAGGFLILDVSEPTNVRQINRTQVPNGAVDVAVVGDLAYVTDRGMGVLVAQVSLSDWGRLVGLISLPSGAADRVALTTNGLVAEAPGWGFYSALAGCNTLTPVFLSSFSAEATADVVALRWQAAVSGQGEFRLVARTGGNERDIAFTTLGNGLFTARDTAAPAGGSVTYALLYREADAAWTTLAERAVDLPAARTALLNPWPNPFNPRTTVAFTLARSGPARLTVYDAAGRLVAVLADGPCTAGRTELTWDGTDVRGHALASGTFLLRLEAEGTLATRRLTLVR